MSASVKGLTRLAALALPMLLGSAGCNTYKYFDVTPTFDHATFQDYSQILTISRCRVLVSGADTSNFILDRCPNAAAADPYTGITDKSPGGYSFEFSTFADSGTLNFELQAFVGQVDKPECMIGDGKLPLAVTGATTIMGNLVVNKNPNFASTCVNVSPVNDGGM
jgi:hypothetical protein